MTIITVILTSYLTFKDIINSHNKQQYSAIIPLFSLVTSELLRPLRVANFMANNQFVIDYANQENIEKSYVFSYLEHIAKSYNMLAFVAFEKHDLMLDSSGKETELTSELAKWFHRFKDMPGDQFTDIGNMADPHLYFDNRIKGRNGEFIGFTGVAIDLNYFAKKFQEYNERFGFELIFVDSNNIITLSSNDLMRTDSHHREEAITRLDELPWYQSLIKSHIGDKALNAEIMYATKEGLLISQMPIQELNWRMFVVSPPAIQQSEYWKIFIARFALFFIIAIIFYLMLLTTVNYFKSRLISHSETDHLTQLPNRSHVHRRFDEIRKNKKQLSVVLADIDHFKDINDKYGHLIGDDVLRIVAEQLSQSLRKVDVIGRWGGEEFVMLLPETTAEQSHSIVERIRKNIAAISFPLSATSGSFTITISFGICEMPLKDNNINDYIACADKALYEAKNNGRNQSVIFN
ncbi:MAG: diguanylate cyclase domain-containing protein [Cognaticolwellia sp.]